MKPQFTGVFRLRDLPGRNIGAAVHPGKPSHFIDIQSQYVFVEGDGACFVWGRFYDLEKTCADLNVDFSENPAELFFRITKEGKPEKTMLFYGAYTFVYYDHKQLIAGRDIIGAGSPFYYSDRFFASSLGAFKHLDQGVFVPDPESIRYFLHLGTVLAPQTIIHGIRSLLPGELLVSSNGTLHLHNLISYDRFKRLYNGLRISEEEALTNLRNLHQAAIRRRVQGKNKVALLLSGGYDSGGNLAALREVYGGKADGYSIGFKNDPWSELPLAGKLAKTFDVGFHHYQIDGSEIQFLPEIVRHLDNPFHENGLMVNYCVMKMVQHHNADVILGGDGNDQLYGTGSREMALYHLLSSYGLRPLQRLLACGLKAAGNRFPRLTRVAFHNNRILHSNSLDSFGFSAAELNTLFLESAGDICTDVLKTNQLKVKSFDDLFVAHSFFKSFLHDGLNLIIYKASTMATMFDQPLSFPYMDNDMVEFIWSLPRQLRVSGNIKEMAKGHSVSKYLHKQYLKDKLPDEITGKKKQGGFAPLPVFFRDEEQRRIIFEIIRKSDVADELFNKTCLEKILAQLTMVLDDDKAWFWHKQNMACKVMNLLVLSLWWDIHYKNREGTLLGDFL